jgi:hypothetical protein
MQWNESIGYLRDWKVLLSPAPLQGVSESVRKRRERGKRRDADTNHSCVRLSAPALPYQNNYSLMIACLIF